MSFFNQLSKWLEDNTPDEVKNGVKNVVEGANSAKNAVQDAYEAAQNAKNAVQGAVGAAQNAAKGAAQGAINGAATSLGMKPYDTGTHQTPTPNTSAPTKAEAQPNAAPKTAPTYDKNLDLSQYKYDPTQDIAYQQALNALQQATGNRPTYAATYDQQLNDLYDKIVNRDKHSYDLNGDMFYQQAAQQYTQMGNMAMQDAMGQAAAMTGGYGSSYGQMVGQQAYQGYMQQLNDKIPEFYDRSLARYNQEGQDLLNQYAMLGDMQAQEYQRYQDSLNQYWQNVSYQKQLADEAYNRGYSASRDQASDAAAEYDTRYQQWLNQQNMQHQYDREAVEDQHWADSFQYQKDQDALAQQNWQAQFDYGKTQDAQQQANWDKQFNHGVAQDQQAQQNWQNQFNYGKDQDALDRAYQDKLYEYGVSQDKQNQANWQAQFDYGKTQDAQQQANWDKQFNHGVAQDQQAQQNWQNQFNYGKDQDALDRAYQDKLYEYGVSQDKQNQANWQAQFDYGKTQDQQAQNNWEAQFGYSKKQDSYNNLVSLISSTGYKPTASELKAAGMSADQAKAYGDYYEKSLAYNNASAAGNGMAHVSAMSSTEIVEAMQGYQAMGDNSGLESFLDDCVATGRMTEAQADAYYEKYGTGLKAPELIVPIVPKPTAPGSSGSTFTNNMGGVNRKDFVMTTR